ncbi:lytic transglycosylase domain-containing protein [Chelativorans multitrophicus]|uniref:lytic transglycosylase domain-containing protein n=1 Tax=Chelativorans multitrophicus TaxID=449973 RepID=UPI00140BF9CF|nr:lytic transglycosylase domain-containing protein [Chelativorans multitrophicus]
MPVLCIGQAGRQCGGRRHIASLLLTGLVLAIAPPPVTMAQTVPVERPEIGGPYAAFIAEAAQRFGMPALWIAAVLDAESAGDQRAVSSAGARGLMQVMPDTWAELRVRYRFGDNPFAARDNIMAGAAYLREMWDLYGNVGAMLAAYNAGPGRYDEYLSTGRPLPAETRAYVTALAPILGREPLPEGVISRPPVPADWREAPLFVTGFDAVPTAPHSPAESADPEPSETIFVPRAGDGVQP